MTIHLIASCHWWMLIKCKGVWSPEITNLAVCKSNDTRTERWIVITKLWTSNTFLYSDIIMSAMKSQITGVSIVYYHRLNRLVMRRSKKTSKLRVTGLCAGNSPVTGEFPAQRASYAENVSIDDDIMDLASNNYEVRAWSTTYQCRMG